MSAAPETNGIRPSKPKNNGGKKEVKILMLHGMYLFGRAIHYENSQKPCRSMADLISLIRSCHAPLMELWLLLIVYLFRLHAVRTSLPGKDARR